MNENYRPAAIQVPIPEVEELMEELESNALKGIYPLSRTPLLPYVQFQKALFAPAVQQMSISSLPIITDSPVFQKESSLMTKYPRLFAFIWVSTYVVVGALYTGLTFLYETFPYMLRFSFANIGCFAFFFIMAIQEIYNMGFKKFKKTVSKYKEQRKKIILTIIFYTLSQISYVFPVKYTSIALNNLFVQCTGICIVIWKIITCTPTHLLAIFGTAIGLTGGGLTILEYGEENNQFDSLSMLFGNTMSLIGAGCAAAFTINTWSFMKEKFPVAIFSTILTTVCVLSGIGLCYLVEYDEMAKIEWNISVFWVTLLVGFVQWLSQYAVYKSLELVSPLLFSTACLLQFPIAALQAWSMNVNPFPGLWTWLGGSLTVAGLYSIIKSEQIETEQKIENIEKTAAQIVSAGYRKLRCDST